MQLWFKLFVNTGSSTERHANLVLIQLDAFSTRVQIHDLMTCEVSRQTILCVSHNSIGNNVRD